MYFYLNPRDRSRPSDSDERNSLIKYAIRGINFNHGSVVRIYLLGDWLQFIKRRKNARHCNVYETRVIDDGENCDSVEYQYLQLQIDSKTVRFTDSLPVDDITDSQIRFRSMILRIQARGRLHHSSLLILITRISKRIYLISIIIYFSVYPWSLFQKH